MSDWTIKKLQEISMKDFIETIRVRNEDSDENLKAKFKTKKKEVLEKYKFFAEAELQDRELRKIE